MDHSAYVKATYRPTTIILFCRRTITARKGYVDSRSASDTRYPSCVSTEHPQNSALLPATKSARAGLARVDEQKAPASWGAIQ